MLPISDKKACMLLSYRPIHFRFVARSDEISNLRLLQYIIKIIDFVDFMGKSNDIF